MTNSIQSYRIRIKRMNPYEVSVYITVFAGSLIFIGIPYRIDSLVSSGTMLLIISNALCALFCLINKLKHNCFKYSDLPVIFIMITSLIALVLSGINNSIYISLVALLGYWAIPFYFIYYKNVSNKRKVKDFVYKSYTVFSLFYIYLSLTPLSHRGYSKWGTYEGYLTLGYNNPNETGMYLLICFIVILSATMFYEKKFIKVFLWLNMVYLLYLINQTNSRTCLLVALFVLVVTFTRKKIKKWHIITIMLVPFIFMILNLVYTEWISEIIILGNSAESGRNHIYEYYLANLNGISFLIGDFSSYRFSNTHNAYISILATVGLLGFLPFFLFFQTTLFWIKEHCLGQKSQQVAFIGLIGIIIHSSAEAAFLVSGLIFASSVGILYLLTLPDR